MKPSPLFNANTKAIMISTSKKLLPLICALLCVTNALAADRYYFDERTQRYTRYQPAPIRQQAEQFNNSFHFPELGLGYVVGMAIATMLQKHAPVIVNHDGDDDLVSASKIHRHRVGKRLDYDQRLMLLTTGFAQYNIEHLNMADVTQLTYFFSQRQIERFIKLVTRIATEYHINFLELAEQHDQIFTSHAITMSMIHEVLDEMHGGSKSHYKRDAQDRIKTAVHEAGHTLAILHNEQRYQLHFVSTIARATSNGRNFSHCIVGQKDTVENLHYDIMVRLCGGVAEQLFGFDTTWFKKRSWAYKPYQTRAKISTGLIDLLSRTSVGQDIIEARDIATYMIEKKLITPTYFNARKKVDMPVQIDHILEACYQQAVQLLTAHKSDIQKIADLLMQQDIVSGSNIYALF